MKKTLSIIIVSIAALLSLGFATQDGTQVLAYSSINNLWTGVVIAGLASVGLIDLFNRKISL